MTCMVLPSETARLVYGYLVKEKLDNIALQFLEHSPYLTDCYHIVKSGYQFNTKFLYKELHELLQEYSTIQNLVNKKVGLLSKSSPLYKRIKLQCENVSEIVDLILFWRYNESKSEESSPTDNKNVSEKESKTDKINEMTVNTNSVPVQDSECSEYVSSSTPRNDRERGETEDEIFREGDCTLNNKFLPDKNDSNQTGTNINCMVDGMGEANAGSGVSNGNEKYAEMEVENDNGISELGKDDGDMNMPMAAMDHNCVDKSNKIEISLIPNEPDVVNIDGQIKIVRIEKDNQVNEDVNQPLNPFTQQLDGMDSGMNMENGQVLYVTPDGGNITINQDRNQIIVIPIDYYKAQPSCQTDIGNEQTQAQNLVGNGAKSMGPSNEIIFEGNRGYLGVVKDSHTANYFAKMMRGLKSEPFPDVPVPSSSVPMTTPSTEVPYNASTEKKSFVDDTIVTEGTYLKNKDLIYELESKLKPQIFPDPVPVKETEPVAPIPAAIPTPVQLSTIFVSQVIEQPDPRYRRILPRKNPSYDKIPIIVGQPLVENNSVVRTNKTTNTKTKKNSPKKKAKASAGNAVKPETKQTKEVLNMPSIRTPAHENKAEERNNSEEKAKEAQNEKINEEKENLETAEKTIETPVVIVNKNTKRLSLSTPRRRSHIRALEFETPPKSGNEKKKSRTSPKAKVDEVKVKNKNVRNTLFKSPDLETSFKTPSDLKPEKKCSPNSGDANERLGDPSPPVATRSPNAKQSDVWESVTGIGCVIGGAEKKAKKSWDADLRDFISAASSCASDSTNVTEKKRTRKPKKSQKDDKQKKAASPKKSKLPQAIPSPSKISLTAKRNTYSISGNEEGSPVRSLLEELDLVTPFKYPEPVRAAEETPLTKLFRENVNGLDIDLNMINTPTFPPTPSIIITPDVDDSLSMPGTYYYTPIKDSAKEKVAKVEVLKNELMKIESLANADDGRKKGTKETHEKVIGELVSKAKEIIGLRRPDSEEPAIKKPPSGKVLSMVKIQMITQCDKKLYENIPINEESVNEQETTMENVSEESAKFDLKCELEEKKQRALKKIKSVKENFSVQTRKRKLKRSPVKRKRSGDAAAKPGKKLKTGSPNTSGEGKSTESSMEKDAEIYHSTPYADKGSRFDREDSGDQVDRTLLDEIREEFPSFHDSGEFPELPVKTRKKLHYIAHFLKSNDIVKFLESYGQKNNPKLKLKRSHKKFFQVFYKWLRHPHAREVNTSDRTKNLFKEYRTLFEKIKTGVSFKIGGEDSEKDSLGGDGGFPVTQCPLSDDDAEVKHKTNVKKKEDDAEDGPVSILPLKKRKATVQPLELNGAEATGSTADKTETPSRTQTFLQDIDVDRFLSQIHGQENR